MVGRELDEVSFETDSVQYGGSLLDSVGRYDVLTTGNMGARREPSWGAVMGVGAVDDLSSQPSGVTAEGLSVMGVRLKKRFPSSVKLVEVLAA